MLWYKGLVINYNVYGVIKEESNGHRIDLKSVDEVSPQRHRQCSHFVKTFPLTAIAHVVKTRRKINLSQPFTIFETRNVLKT
jgi:hypothetical protein